MSTETSRVAVNMGDSERRSIYCVYACSNALMTIICREKRLLRVRLIAAGISRDRNTIVDWDKLQRVLEDIVAGHPGYPRTESAADVPHFSDVEER